MSYNEASNAIKQIQDEVNSFHNNLISFVGYLNAFANKVSQIDYEKILHEQLINNINDTFRNLNSDLKSIVELCSTTYDTLIEDANMKIYNIVDAYNNSIKDDEENKTRLSYISLSSDSFSIKGITNFN